MNVMPLKNLATFLFTCACIVSPLQAEVTTVGETESYDEPSLQNPNRGLLIFLDDTESDDAQSFSKIGVISHAFLTAFVQGAGPIIVSASLIANVRQRTHPMQDDQQKLFDRFTALRNATTHDDTEILEMKSIMLSIASFNEDTIKKWIIKRINDSLYLLLPKTYVTDLQIAISDVEAYQPNSPLTSAEKIVGIKINHMQTVTDIDTIKKPLPAPPIPFYFMEALWDEQHATSNIFVTNNEYAKNMFNTIPIWSILISGHGYYGTGVAALLFAQFKQFLTFLEKKLNTALLYYVSCYAAGVNNKLLYEDAERGIDKTYSFAIITQALTDAAVIMPFLSLKLIDGKLIPTTFIAYEEFIKKVTMPESIIVDPHYLKLSISGFPQIKLPGLSWFSIIDSEKFCVINTILAKTRTAPLDIANFFAKKGTKATPLGILLYASDLPFELIIDTKNETNLPPAIISMIPGKAMHHIKQISTTLYTLDDMLRSFLRISMLAPQKIFIIDTLKAVDSDGNPIVADDVTIHLTPQQNSVYYTHKGTLFKIIQQNLAEKASEADKTKYIQLLEISQPQKKTITTAQIAVIEKEAIATFAQPMIQTELQQKIVALLDFMPHNAALHIPQINGISCPPAQTCWVDFVYMLSQYTSFAAHKIIWLDKLTIYNTISSFGVEKITEPLGDFFINIIIDVSPQETIVFATGTKMICASSSRGMFEQTEPYIPLYQDTFKHFNTYLQLPSSAIVPRIPTTHELLTPAAINSIEQAQLSKLIEQKSTLQEKSKEKQESTKGNIVTP